MNLAFLDWLLIGLFFGITLTIGIILSTRAGKNVQEFFLSGRNLPWYVAGVSMVATTFAADTPLAVTELVASQGIAGNWLWWNFMIGGMLTTFFFARLWRRANILTEVEFIELRYSGKGAAFLRLFRSIYLGLFMNALIIGWVNLAFMTLLEVFFGIPPGEQIFYVAIAMLVIAMYSSLAGLWGVAVNDALQFVIAMTGSIMLAYFVISSEQVGGMTGLKSSLPKETFHFFPDVAWDASAKSAGKVLTLGLGSFLAYIAVIWWSSWYPGNEPGGGGYIAQRMMSTKDEKNAIYATLFFQIGHYCLRPWPWILVGLATLVLYPDLSEEDKRLGYVMAMRDYLPVGWKGLMLVAFVSAYMSTISTQLNWGASYLYNDLYQRFFVTNPEATSGKKMVWVSRLITVAIAAVGLTISVFSNTITGIWHFVLECGAGLGLVLILRWYWWRINVWSEIAASIMPFILYAICKFLLEWEFPNSFFLTVGGTTLTWLMVTFLTPPERTKTLQSFYQRIKPGGFWEPIRLSLKEGKPDVHLWKLAMCWLSAILMTYSMLFAIGKMLFLNWSVGFVWLAVSIFGFLVLRYFTHQTRIFN